MRAKLRDPSEHGVEFYTMLRAVGRNAILNLGVFPLASQDDTLYQFFMDPQHITDAFVESYVAYGTQGIMNTLAASGGRWPTDGPPGQMNGGFEEGIIGHHSGPSYAGSSCGGADYDRYDKDDYDNFDDYD